MTAPLTHNPTPHEQLALLVGGQVRDADTILAGAHQIRTSAAGVVRLDGLSVLGTVGDGPLALARAFDREVQR